MVCVGLIRVFSDDESDDLGSDLKNCVLGSQVYSLSLSRSKLFHCHALNCFSSVDVLNNA